MRAGPPKCAKDPRVVELAEALKVLSDPNRLRIMCYLAGGERCVCHVEQELGISQQLTSHHLNVMKDAGLLKMRKEGTWSFYSVDIKKLRRIDEAFFQFLDFRKAKRDQAAASCCT